MTDIAAMLGAYPAPLEGIDPYVLISVQPCRSRACGEHGNEGHQMGHRAAGRVIPQCGGIPSRTA